MIAVVILTLLFPGSVQAQTPACASLSGQARATADAVLSTAHPYDCCDDTIATCVAKRPDCRLAARLADFVCRRAASGLDSATILRSLEKRAVSMMRPGKTVTIDPADGLVAGNPQAKTVLSAYVCLRCPMCSKLVPQLLDEVRTGRLSGKARLLVKPFTVKSHEHSAEANIALAAALRLGRGWEFLRVAFLHFDAFRVDALPLWAVEAGLDRERFLSAQAEAREIVVNVKKEGLRIGVEATPTLFLNGRRYAGDLDVDAIVDCVEEEAEVAR